MFCNAIDDSLMGVTNVLRGEDHLANTPRQLMILEALKLRQPSYGHLSLITNDDSMRLSKRLGSFSLHDLREEGYLPEAVLNYLSRLTHTYDTAELLDFKTLAQKFRLDKLSRSPARFDRNQLLHWQKEAILAIKDKKILWEWLGDSIKEKVPVQKRDLFADMMKNNVLFPREAQHWVDILFGEKFKIAEEKIALLENTPENFFTVAREIFAEHQGDLKSIFDDLKKTFGISGKNLFMPLRLALTGEEHGPELIHIVACLGLDEAVSRLKDPRRDV
jgi:glutamyl-tRNA synthetase